MWRGRRRGEGRSGVSTALERATAPRDEPRCLLLARLGRGKRARGGASPRGHHKARVDSRLYQAGHHQARVYCRLATSVSSHQTKPGRIAGQRSSKRGGGRTRRQEREATSDWLRLVVVKTAEPMAGRVDPAGMRGWKPPPCVRTPSACEPCGTVMALYASWVVVTPSSLCGLGV